MISNLREDKDVIYSVIFIALVALSKVSQLFVLANLRAVIDSLPLSHLNKLFSFFFITCSRSLMAVRNFARQLRLLFAIKMVDSAISMM